MNISDSIDNVVRSLTKENQLTIILFSDDITDITNFVAEKKKYIKKSVSLNVITDNKEFQKFGDFVIVSEKRLSEQLSILIKDPLWKNKDTVSAVVCINDGVISIMTGTNKLLYMNEYIDNLLIEAEDE